MKDLTELEKQYKITQEQHEQTAKQLEALGEEIQQLKQPKTHPMNGQQYWTITFQAGDWDLFSCKWGIQPTHDQRRLNSGICFWEGTDEENKAAAGRAILRCRYVLEGQWKPRQGQEVWAWQSDGSTVLHIFSWNSQSAVRWLSEGYYSPTKEEAEKRWDEFREAFL